MTSPRELLSRLVGTLRRRSVEPELDEEIRFHLEMQAAKNVRLGMAPDTARRAALVRFGGQEQIKEAVRDEYRSRPLEDFVHDLRFGIRSAFRVPLFSLLAVLTLALGIGANAAVFGVVKSVLLDALPYADAGRLQRIYGRLVDGSLERSSLSAGTVTDVAARQRSFTRVAWFYHGTVDVTFATDAEPTVLKAAIVGPGFLQTLGVSPVVGRPLADADAAEHAPAVGMLSFGAWQRLFGGDPAVVGRSVSIDGDRSEIVGVLPRGFVGPMGDADLWLPLDLSATLADPVRARKQHWLGMIGRLRPETTPEAAERELLALAADLAREQPEGQTGFSIRSVSLRDDMVGETRTPLIILMASAALVLLITCANLAGALLSRTISRRREFAVRLALGAGRGRLIRQLLTESTLLAATGGLAGVALAMVGLSLLRRLALSALPAYAELSLDPGTLLFTFALALATGLAFGMAPALAVGRANPQGTLRDESRGSSESPRSRQLRGALVAAQIALSVSLLVGAGLLVRSLRAMTTAPLGFEPAGVLAATIQLPPARYGTTSARIRFFASLEERVRALPGVTEVGTASELPSPNMNRNGLTIEGVAWTGDEQPFIPQVSVSPDYFRTMRIAVRGGRTFGAGDVETSPPVVVISEAMAKRYWPNGGAVGARVRLGPNTATTWGEVIGIVADVRNDPARPTPEPMAYSSSRQETYGARTFLIRTTGDPLALVKPVQTAIAALDPALPLYAATPLETVLADGLSARRLPVLLLTAFGVLALLVASVGVYAMFAAMAGAREREFGVRMALGSSRGAIAALVFRQGAAWMAAGLAVGGVGILIVARLLQKLLYGVSPFDPVALGGAIATLIACAAVALLVPVRRATRVDPISVLR
jgi:putative ABC transport system permease protein